jgi:hypothetical protein
MSFVTAAMIAGGATLASSLIGSRAASKAADVQARAAEQGTAAQERMFAEQNRLQEPFRQGGMAAQNRLLTYFGLPGGAEGADFGRYTRDFGTQDFQQDPGYAFRLAEGQKALDRQAAARGGLISGGALKAAQRYGQDMGSQEYQNAFNRYQTNRANQLQPLQSLMGAGQTAANTLTNAAGVMGQNQAAGLSNAAQARASGYVGGANALTGGLNQYLNYTQGQNMLGMLQNRGGTGGFNTGGANADLVMNPYFGTMGGNQ